MKLNNTKPKRTIIFSAWAGGEFGLLGSKFYAENPVYPIKKTVAYINMDMFSHSVGKLNFMGIYYGPEIWNLLRVKLPKDLLDKAKPSRCGLVGSDHSCFLYDGVFAFFIYTTSHHFKCHAPVDAAELAKSKILKTVGNFTGVCVDILANESNKNFIQALRQATY
jgi:aminopeptidase YwaD